MLATAKDWNGRVADAELIARTDGFRHLRDRIVELAEPQPWHTVVDLGSGTGLLSLAFAEQAARVWAIDSSSAMSEYLRVKAASADLHNVETVVASAVSLPLVDGVADLVVSNYCLHELRRADKYRALAEARRVLRPGGRLVIGDMMFSLNPVRARDRRVIAGTLRKLAARGLPGAWRLLKNLARLASGRWEYPADARWWRQALAASGFHEVGIELMAHEGGIATAQARPRPQPSVARGERAVGSSGARPSGLKAQRHDRIVNATASVAPTRDQEVAAERHHR
jgi:ubiquinone/menaquinone biosynthesis C-methylase UbiE